MFHKKNNKDQIETLKAVIASDHHSRAAYTGCVMQKEMVTVFHEDGTPFEKEVSFSISWDSISEILSLARKRAGL